MDVRLRATGVVCKGTCSCVGYNTTTWSGNTSATNSGNCNKTHYQGSSYRNSSANRGTRRA